MTTNSQNNNLISRLILTLFAIIPTIVSLFLAFQVRTMSEHIHENSFVENEPQIVCFDPDVCAIEVLGKWYRISGVIQMDDVVPEDYKLELLIDEADTVRIEEITTEEN